MFTKYGISALIVSLFSTAACWACPCGEVTLHPEEQFKDNPAAGIEFSHTEAYKKDFQTAIANARAAAEKFVGKPNCAIVFDIDETLLDNRQFFIDHKEFKWAEFNVWVEEARAPNLPETAEFLSWARQKGFAIFLITGRMEKDRRGTIKNLVKNGIAYDGLYMRPDGNHSPAKDVKTPLRVNIENMGFQIVANIGDQWSDLAGGHAEDCEKLPNRMYFVP